MKRWDCVIAAALMGGVLFPSVLFPWARAAVFCGVVIYLFIAGVTAINGIDHR